jgi:hypothetical protein
MSAHDPHAFIIIRFDAEMKPEFLFLADSDAETARLQEWLRNKFISRRSFGRPTSSPSRAEDGINRNNPSQ